ncbi:MAG: phosphoglycerate kinase [candidate division Zixibacteria bacterium]|nr:phosphoglycerate kinase [candidate division Zixibacteria bacterium]
MKKLTIDDLELTKKKVLVRVDFNVPLDKNGSVMDDTRIQACLPTIKKILKSQGKVILMSHLGRPKGRRSPDLSLRPCAERLSQLLGRTVGFVGDCIGAEVKAAISELQPGECLLLENLRFHPGEERNDPAFARALADLGDIFVNDAFGAAHRSHASNVGITNYVNFSAAGYLMQKELEYLTLAVVNPARPFVTILGGAKVSDKLGIIENLFDKCDALLVGGGMAFTFVKAAGGKIGGSLLEESKLDYCKSLLEKSKADNLRIVLAVDAVIPQNGADGQTQIVPIDSIPDAKKGLDIGPQTSKLFNREIERAKTILWNGPLGMFEKEAYSSGTFEAARKVAQATQNGAVSIIGGGDTAAAVMKAGVADKMSHVSTGGGAALEFLAGNSLPGVEALTDKA